jgi:hypothetical protein
MAEGYGAFGLQQRRVKTMSDSYIEIDGGEVVDIPSNATTPEALKRAAAFLRRQSEKPPDSRFAHFATEPETRAAPSASLADQIGFRRIDEPYDEAEARTNRARAEIMVAIEREKSEAEQQRKQDLADARAKAQQTSLGRLLGVSRHG